MTGVRVIKEKKIGEYTVCLVKGQIGVYVNEELVKAFDIKDINKEFEEFDSFVVRFTEANNKRNSK